MNKAALFNLVIYTADEQRAAYMNRIAKDIAEKFPCRIIFIKGSKTGDHLTISPGDELTINAGVEKLHQVRFTVIPNLVADIPIYLLWGQDPTSDNVILPYLEAYAKRLIFDSECTLDLQQFAKQMELKLEATKTSLTDINWAHISGWRTVIAKVFDSEALVGRLKHAQKIRITYNDRASEFVRNHETKAIYLQGWLASCLGWKLSSASLKKILYQGTEVELVAGEEPGTPPGAIIGVEIEGENFECKILRKQETPKVLVHMTTDDRCELPLILSLPDLKKRSVYMREVFYTSINSHYRNMLKAIGQVKWEMK